MADPYDIPSTVDTVALSTSLADYRKLLTDNVYNDTPMLRLCQSAGTKRMINGGLSIVETLIKEKQDDGGWYLGADVLNNSQGDDTAMIEIKWQNMYEPVMVTRDEERVNSGDQHKIIDLVGAKMQMAELSIKERLDQALSVPVGAANNLNDIDTVVGTGTLGTIDGSTDTFFQSTVTTSGSFAVQGLGDMTTAFYAVSGSSNAENPTAIMTNKTIFKYYEDTRLPLERISSGDMTANAGFRNLTFKGIPVIYGNYIGSGKLYGLNMNYIYLAVDSATDMITTPFVSPTNQTVKVAYILWRGNLYTNNRRRQFKLQSITA